MPFISLEILIFQFAASKMDSLPPNDPNRNNDNNGRQAAKEQPYDGSRGNNNNANEDRQPMDIMGDMSDSPAVVVMFLVGLAAWFLREQCIC